MKAAKEKMTEIYNGVIGARDAMREVTAFPFNTADSVFATVQKYTALSFRDRTMTSRDGNVFVNQYFHLVLLPGEVQ